MAQTKLPYNIEAEKSVLGALIASENSKESLLSRLDKEDFYDNNHQIIFEAIESLMTEGIKIDLPSLTDILANRYRKLDEIGGVDYLVELADSYIGDSNANYHLVIIKDAALSRKYINTLEECLAGFGKKIDDVSQYISECENKLIEVSQRRRVAEFQSSINLVDQVAKTLRLHQKVEKTNRWCIGVPTGYEELDKKTLGWQKGNLIILAARPSVGKTAFAINLMYNAVRETSKPVAFFSVEMGATDIVRRFMSCASGVEGTKLFTGDLDDNDWLGVETGIEKLNRTPIFIDDTSGITINDIITKSKKLKTENPTLQAIFIDYLGLIRTNMPDSVSVTHQIDRIMSQLKGLARDLDIPVICLSQLSRANEKEKRPPVMADLRDSGGIEQTADQVIFIHRKKYQKPADENQDNQNGKEDFEDDTKIIVSKNRNGKTGEVDLLFDMNKGRFIAVDTGNH